MSIEVPPACEERIERLVAAVQADLPGEPAEAVRRLVELAVLSRGIRAVEQSEPRRALQLEARADELARTRQ